MRRQAVLLAAAAALAVAEVPPAVELALRMKADAVPRTWDLQVEGDDAATASQPGLRGACSASRLLADGTALGVDGGDPRDCCCGYHSTSTGNCTQLQSTLPMNPIDFSRALFNQPQIAVFSADSSTEANNYDVSAGFGAGRESFRYIDIPDGVKGLVFETCGTPCARLDRKSQCVAYANSYGPQVLYLFNSCPRGYPGASVGTPIPPSAVVAVSANASAVYPGGCVRWNEVYTTSTPIAGGNLNQSILFVANPAPGRYWLGMDGGTAGLGGFITVWATVLGTSYLPSPPPGVAAAMPAPVAPPPLPPQVAVDPPLRAAPLVPALPTPSACCTNCSANLRALVGNEGYISDSTAGVPSKVTAIRLTSNSQIEYTGGERVYALNVSAGGAAALNIDTCDTPANGGASSIIYLTLACPWLVSGRDISFAAGLAYPQTLLQVTPCPGSSPGVMANITNLPPGLYYVLVDSLAPGGAFTLSWSMTLYPGTALPPTVVPWMFAIPGAMPDCPAAVPAYPTVSVTPTPTSTPTASVTPTATASSSASVSTSPSFTPSLSPSPSPACLYNPAPGTFNMVSTAMLVSDQTLPTLTLWRLDLAKLENGTTPVCHIRRIAARLVGVEPTNVIVRLSTDAYFNETWTPGMPVDFTLNDCKCIPSIYASACTNGGPPPANAWDSGQNVIQRASVYSPKGTLMQINVILPAGMSTADASKRLLMLNAPALDAVCTYVPTQLLRLLQAIFYYSLPLGSVANYQAISNAADTVVVAGLDPGRAPSASPKPGGPDNKPDVPIGLIVGIVLGLLFLLLLLLLLSRYVRRKKAEAARQRSSRRSTRGGSLGAAAVAAPTMEMAAPVPVAVSSPGLSNERGTRVTQMGSGGIPGAIATANPAAGVSSRGRTMLAPSPKTATLTFDDDAPTSSARHLNGDDRERAAFTPQMRRGSSAGRRR